MNKEKIERYCIYAIIAGKKAFVGKTTSDDYGAILRRHRRGEIKHTRKHFGRRGSAEPKFVALLTVEADCTVAYRYVVAFMRCFLDDGYEVLNSCGMIDDARDLHFHTQKILESIKLIPLTIRLQKMTQKEETENQMPNPIPEGSHDQAVLVQKELATEKLTVRLTPTDKKILADLAKQTGVSQSQLLMLLLENYEKSGSAGMGESCIDYVRRMLSKYEDRIETLEGENRQLRQRLREIKEGEKEAYVKREREFHKTLTAYFGNFVSLLPDNPPLDQGLYRDYLANTPSCEQAGYPETEGPFVFFPERVMLGREKRFPLFIAGYDRYRRKTLLRFYPKKYYVGLNFADEEYGVQGSSWLVRCERAKDGAMDLVFALPLDIVHKDYQNVRSTFVDPFEEFMTKLDEEIPEDSIVEQDDEPDDRTVDGLLAWAKRQQKNGQQK